MGNISWPPTSPTLGTGAPHLFDPDDYGSIFNITVTPDAAGAISWRGMNVSGSAASSVMTATVVGFYGAGSSSGFEPVERRTLVSTSSGVGTSTAPAGSIVVDASSQNSGIPSSGVGTVQVSVLADMPANSWMWIGKDATSLVPIGVNVTGSTAVRTISMPVPVDSSSRFVVKTLNMSNGAEVGSAWMISADGWFSTHGASFISIPNSGQRIDLRADGKKTGSPTDNDALIADRTTKTFQVAGQGAIPTHGVSAVLASVHFLPVEGSTTLHAGRAAVYPSGSPMPTSQQGDWDAATGASYVESFVTTVPLGADGKLNLYYEYNDVSVQSQSRTLRAYVDVLGYYCDRDLPTSGPVASSSHPAGSWSPQTQVAATWSEATTAPEASGVAGYAVAINDDGYYEPPAVVTSPSPSFSGRVATGRRWLHVRPVSVDGTGGRTVHYPLQTQSACSSLAGSSYVPIAAPATSPQYAARNELSLLTLGGYNGVPTDATAVRLSVDVTPMAGKPPSEFGALFVYPAGEVLPTGAPIVFDREPVSTEVVVRLGEYDGVPGRVMLQMFSSANFKATVTGYYMDADGQGYTPLATSHRVFSTYVQQTGKIQSRTISASTGLGGSTGIPATGVSAVVATFLWSGATAAGSLQVRPDGSSTWTELATVSKGDVTVDLSRVQATVPLGANGQFQVRFVNAAGAVGPLAHLGVDLFGSYSADGSEFHPLPEGSRRILHGTQVLADSTITVPVGGVQGLPNAGVSAIEGSLHVAPVVAEAYSGLNYMTAYPTGSARPGTAVDQWDDSATTQAAWHSTGVHVALGAAANGKTSFELYNLQGTQTVFFDASGYFCRPTPVITSTSHPAESDFYEPKPVEVAWTLGENPAGIAGYQVKMSPLSDFAFASTASPALVQATSAVLPGDAPLGASWVYVRAISKTGVPSETARYRINTGRALSSNEKLLGMESWWSFDAVPLARTGAAQVNVASGNLVVQQDDIPAIQGAGDLAFNLRRTYNSQDENGLTDGVFGLDIGRGWSLNNTDMASGGGLGLINLPAVTGTLRNPGPQDLFGVTMVDRDGTPHTFTPTGLDASIAGVTASADIEALSSSVNELLADLLSGDGDLGDVLSLTNVQALLGDDLLTIDVDDPALGNGVALCVDLRYKAPPGVHVDLWRYVLVEVLPGNENNPNGACGAISNPSGSGGAPRLVELGYATVRPDRVSQVFSADGRLLALRDAAGNQLTYEYGAVDLGGLDVLPLTRVYQAAPDGSPLGDRQMSFEYNGPNELRVTDPAGRIAVYSMSGLALARQLDRVAIYDADGVDEANVLEEWEFTYCADGLLCEINTPRVLAGDPGATEPVVIDYDGDSRVAKIVESGTESTPGVETTFEYAPMITERTRGGQQVRYSQIDSYGRVGEVTAAATGELDSKPLSRSITRWDNDEAPGDSCNQTASTEGTRDNNLCGVSTIDVDGLSGGDRQTETTFNAEGNPLIVRQIGDASTDVDAANAPEINDRDAVTTFGYRNIEYSPSGEATVVNDAITGPGAVSAPNRGGAVLFTVSDLVETVSPNGNAAGPAWANFRTTMTPDAAESQPVGSVGTGGDCGSGNSGSVCRVDGPEGVSTVSTYNDRGQVTSTTNAPAGAVRYQYFADSAGPRAGWLHQVMDANTGGQDPNSPGFAVTYAYDDASNVTAVWDRNAQGSRGAVPTDLSKATVTSFDTGANNNGPWRWDNSVTLPETAADRTGHGARTITERDRHGNPVVVRPPRGVEANDQLAESAAPVTSFDVTATFDARDLAVETKAPDGANGQNTTTAYFDDNALAVRTVEANGKHSAIVYDGRGLPTDTVWTRSVGTDDIPDGCWAAGSPPAGFLDRIDRGDPARDDDTELLAVDDGSHVVCANQVDYDAFGQARRTADATEFAATSRYDRFGRPTGTSFETQLTAGGAAVTVATGVGYDLNGNQTVTCGRGVIAAVAGACSAQARKADASGSWTDATFAPGVMVTRFDTANRPVETVWNRGPVDAAGNGTPGTVTTLSTKTSYDTAGRVVSTTDANGAKTTIGYDQLSRQIAQTVPRKVTAGATTEAYTTRWRYDPSGNTTAVLTPAGPDTLGAVATAGGRYSITRYEWDAANRGVVQIEAATSDAPDGAVSDLSGIFPPASLPADGAVTNIRTEYAYDADGNTVGVLAPRAFTPAAGGGATVDTNWLTRMSYDNRGVLAATWTAQDPTAAAQNCAAAPNPDAYGGSFDFQPQGTSALVLCRTLITSDDAGNPVEIVTPGSKTVTHRYNLDRLMVAATAPAPDGLSEVSTSARYDAAGRATVADGPGADGTRWVTTTTFTDDGLPVRVSGSGTTEISRASTTYDLAGRPVISTTTGTFDPAKAAASPDQVAETGYLSDGLTALSITGGLQTRYGYDRNGNATSVKQPENDGVSELLHQTFTADNLLLSTSEPVTDGGTTRRTTDFAYDPAGRKTGEHVKTGGAEGRHARYRYQAAGWLAEEFNHANAGQAISYRHNVDGTLATAVDSTGPVDVSIDMAWDTSGRPTGQVTKIGGVKFSTTSASYRPDGEVVTSAAGLGMVSAVTERVYDGDGSVPVSATAKLGTAEYRRSPGGVVLTPASTTQNTVTYGWTPTGALASVAVAGTAMVETRSFRVDGAVTGVSLAAGKSLGFDVDAAGRVVSQVPSSGFVGAPAQAFRYDLPGRVVGDGDRTYGYDGNNNRTVVTDTAPPSETVTVFRPDNTQASYSVSSGGTVVGSGEFPFDLAGRQTHPFPTGQTSGGVPVTDGRDDCVYVYDFLNRTVGINDTATGGCVDPNPPADDEGTYTLFVHDPLGRQIVQVTAPSVTGADDPDTGLAGSLVGVVDSGWDTTAGSFTTVPVGVVVDARVYDHDGGVEATVHTRDEVIETSAYGANNRLLASTKTGSGVGPAKVQVLNTDGHGNIVEVATITGGSGSCYRFYDPFGGVHPDLAGGSVCTESATSNRLWYRGGQQSSVDGTYTFGSRHYSPASGTWTTPDTARPGAPLTDLSIGTDPLTQNRYSYVNGDPINMVDPTGHMNELGAGGGGSVGEDNKPHETATECGDFVGPCVMDSDSTIIGLVEHNLPIIIDSDNIFLTQDFFAGQMSQKYGNGTYLYNEVFVLDKNSAFEVDVDESDGLLSCMLNMCSTSKEKVTRYEGFLLSISPDGVSIMQGEVLVTETEESSTFMGDGTLEPPDPAPKSLLASLWYMVDALGYNTSTSSTIEAAFVNSDAGYKEATGVVIHQDLGAAILYCHDGRCSDQLEAP